jgi:protein SCO1/2
MSAPPVGGSFTLVDHHHNRVTEASYRGRYVLLFFGFTHCRQVCPAALLKLSTALDLLGPLATDVRALYVTVDPERDSSEVLRGFLSEYPRFTGLTGSAEQVDVAKRAFRVFARRAEDPEDPEGYAMPHTALSYLLDRDGRYAAHFTDALEAAEIAARIRTQLTGRVRSG